MAPACRWKDLPAAPGARPRSDARAGGEICGRKYRHADPQNLTSDETGEHRLAGPGDDARLNQNFGAWRQEDIHPAAETDNAKTGAPAHPFPLPQVADDTPRHQARDLDHGQVACIASLPFRAQADGHAFIVDAGLVEAGIEELAGA